MPDREKAIRILEGNYKNFVLRHNGELLTVNELIALLKAQEPITGETSDGYHTFNELYHHRAVLFSVIVANYPDRAWKSKKHHDGTMYDNMFIVGIDTPDGQATYHYDIDPYWDMFKCRVLDNAPEWDGHTPAQAIERIGKLKAQEPRVMTLEELDALGDNAIVWLECLYTFDGMKTTTLQPAIYQSENSSPEEDGYYCVVSSWSHSGFYHKDNYGGDWRCWTSRPTDAQREATPWN